MTLLRVGQDTLLTSASVAIRKSAKTGRLTTRNASQKLAAANKSGSVMLTSGKRGIRASVNGILNDANYKAKFGIANPNLKVLSEMKKAGVELFVCGQFLLTEKIDPKTISPDVTVASDALIVLMSYQNDGYALMSY